MSPSSLVPHKVVVCRNSRKGGRLRPAAREPAGHACAPHHQVISEASAVSSLYPAQVVTARLRIIYELWVSLLSTRLGFLAHGHAVISSQAWEHKIDVAVCFSVHFGHPRLLSPHLSTSGGRLRRLSTLTEHFRAPPTWPPNKRISAFVMRARCRRRAN